MFALGVREGEDVDRDVVHRFELPDVARRERERETLDLQLRLEVLIVLKSI